MTGRVGPDFRIMNHSGVALADLSTSAICRPGFQNSSGGLFRSDCCREENGCTLRIHLEY